VDILQIALFTFHESPMDVISRAVHGHFPSLTIHSISLRSIFTHSTDLQKFLKNTTINIHGLE